MEILHNTGIQKQVGDPKKVRKKGSTFCPPKKVRSEGSPFFQLFPIVENRVVLLRPELITII